MAVNSFSKHILVMVTLAAALTACDMKRIDSLAQISPEAAKALSDSDTPATTASIAQQPAAAVPAATTTAAINPYSRPATTNPYQAQNPYTATNPYAQQNRYPTANPYQAQTSGAVNPYAQNPYQAANPYQAQAAVNPYAQQQRKY